MSETIPALNERMAWWREATFGMFIHYGLYSITGRHEWVMNRERIPVEEYALLADRFTAERFDARELARLARRAGQKYMIMTTKHHEGFSLWDSNVNPFNSVNAPAGRDLVAEFVEAARAEGLGVGLYYSLMDWRHPDGAECFHDAAARQRFVEYTHGLVRELMTGYGKIDILWYDVPWPLKPNGWESTQMNYMVRSLQPHILINDRSGKDATGTVQHEDFDTPEQSVKPSPPYRDWETCDTMNRSWGWNMADPDWKSVTVLLERLVTAASGGGNYILNVGPKADGTLESEAVERLEAIGQWLERNGQGESIYGTDRCTCEWTNFAFGVRPATRRGNTMYWHVPHWYGSELSIGGIETPVKRAWVLSTGDEVTFEQTFEPTVRLKMTGLPETAPDPVMTVIAMECDGEPVHRLGAGCVWMPVP